MTINDALQKSIGIFIENNIHEDIVHESQTLDELIEKLNERVVQDPSALDFLLVITDDDGVPSAVITSRELDNFISVVLDYIKKTPKAGSRLVGELNLGETFPPVYVTESPQDTAEKTYNFFKKDLTDIVIGIDEFGVYLGKIKRNNFAEKLVLMTK